MIRALAHLVATAVRVWWLKNVVSDDPNPEYSDLDRRDGLGR